MKSDLFEAVVKNPDEDGPRLEYAATCESTDPERAEFIRLQVAEAVARRAHQDDEARRLFARLFDLPDGYADRWTGSIRDHVKRLRFYRGFVEYVEVDARTFLDRAELLYSLAPIRRLTLTGAEPVLEALCKSPHLARLVSLDFGHPTIGDRGVALIANSPHLRKLARLGFGGAGVTAAGVEALAASQNLPSLREVGGLPDEFREIVWSDQGQTINVLPPPSAPAIEEKYGYKRWLHPMEETKWRGVDDTAL